MRQEVWTAALFLLTLVHGARWTHTLAAWRPAAAALVVLTALPWLADLLGRTANAGLFVLPIAVLVLSLSHGSEWPRWLLYDGAIGVASGIAALLLATGVAEGGTILWEKVALLVLDHEAMRLPVGSHGVLVALAATVAFAAMLGAVRAGPDGASAGTTAALHGFVVGAGLLGREPTVPFLILWGVVGAHLLAAFGSSPDRRAGSRGAGSRVAGKAGLLLVFLVVFAAVELSE